MNLITYLIDVNISDLIIESQYIWLDYLKFI